MRKVLLPISLIVCFFCTACGEIELHQDLTEDSANEIMVLLAENGIKATKKKEVRQNEFFYTVLVRQQDLAAARSLLVKNHLPRRDELGLTGVYKEKGLIPTPDEQKARYLLAIKGEIINSLERLPAIIDVDVVLNVPTQDEFASEASKARMRPTASVIVRAKANIDGTSSLTEAKIQQFVANGVEGLHPRDVSVILSYLAGSEVKTGDVFTLSPQSSDDISLPPPQQELVASDQELLGLKLDKSSKSKLRIYLLIFFVILLLLSTGLIISIVQASRLRRTVEQMPQTGEQAPALEGKVVDEQLGLEEDAADEPLHEEGRSDEDEF